MKVGGEITLSVPFVSEYNLISKWGYPEYGSPYQLIEWKYTLSGTCCRWRNEFIKSENLRRVSEISLIQYLCKEKSRKIASKAPAPHTDFGGVHKGEHLFQLPGKSETLESESESHRYIFSDAKDLLPDHMESVADLNASQLPET